VLRIDQLGKNLIPVGGFGKASARKCINKDLSESPSYVRVIVCYQDIHRLVRMPGRKSDL
jgi:hypothetical protein